MPKSTRYETTDASGLMKLTRQKPRPPQPSRRVAARRGVTTCLPPPTGTFRDSKQGSDTKSGFLLAGFLLACLPPPTDTFRDSKQGSDTKSGFLLAFVYTPAKDHLGGDAFTHLADDRQSSNNRSAPATVRLVVEKESDVAVAVTALRESLVSGAPAREAFRVTVTTPRWRPCRS
jgi:hypothetical protein